MRALILAALLLVPLVPAASPAMDHTSVPPLHIGDRLLYRSTSSESVIDAEGVDVTSFLGRIPWTGEMDTLVTIEGAARARDEYGVERDTVAFRIERARDDRVVAVERCHMEPAMGWALRWDYLEGGPRYTDEWQYRGQDALFGSATRYYNSSPLFESRTGPCDGFWQPGYADFREGESILAQWHFQGSPTMPTPRFVQESEPARATMWNGVPAMEYIFPVELAFPETTVEGHARLVFARGFPGPVVVEMDIIETGLHARWSERGTRELIGFSAGNAPFPYDLPWREHPLRSPTARYAMQDARAAPDAALTLAYPYRDALAAMRADRGLGLSEYLDTHPQAGLIYAEFEERMDPPRVPPVNALGLPAPADATGPGWLACFSDASTEFCARTVRPRGLDQAPFQQREDLTGWAGLVVKPYESASPGDIATLAALAGIEPGTVASFVYSPAPHGDEVSAFILVSQVSYRDIQDGAGFLAQIDATRGALQSAQSASVRTTSGGLLSAASPPRELQPARASASGWDALRVPSVATAAAAATGLALLALVVKLLLVPLYTRLRRDRLLDNPIRARLYDRIRAEPGAHLAELEEFVGIGKGATRHHVDQLVRHHLVFLLEDAGHTRAYASGHVPPEAARRHAVLRAGSLARVYDLYAAEPAMSLREAAARLGVSAPSVHRAKKRLEREGLLPAPPTATVAEA